MLFRKAALFSAVSTVASQFKKNQVAIFTQFQYHRIHFLTPLSYSATLGIPPGFQPKLTVPFCLEPKSPRVKWLKTRSTAHVRSFCKSKLRTVLSEAETRGTVFRKPKKACTVRNKQCGQKFQEDHLAPNSSRSSRDFFGLNQRVHG